MAAEAIDWVAIHRRLAAAEAAVSGDTPRPEAEVCRILELRARIAAKAPAPADVGEHLDVLAFSLAAEHYAVETRHVVEVHGLRELTPLPCTPGFVAGVMNLRGRILAVLDPRVLFDLPARGLTELNRVVVLRSPHTELGLLADSIDGLRSVPVTSLQDALPTLTGIRAQFLKGVTGQMLAVLDGDRLLADAGLKVNDPAATPPR